MKRLFRIRVEFLFIVLLILLGCIGGCDEQKRVLGSNFYEVTGIEQEEVSNIYVEYLDVSVTLDSETKEQILDSFCLARCTEVLEYEPFTESE